MSEDINPLMDNTDDMEQDDNPNDWSEIRKSQYTYIFQYLDKERTLYRPHFDIYSSTNKNIEAAKKVPDFFERVLYWIPDKPPYDFYISHHNWQLALLNQFFNDVFDLRSISGGAIQSHKFFKIILPKTKYDEIINCINDFELLNIRDLLFEVIAIAQENYIENIAFWERPEMQKLVTSAEKESQKAIKIIDKLDHKHWVRSDKNTKKPSELLHINFVYNDETIKLEHNWLAKEFVSHFKDYYNNLGYKNWKLDLKRYPDRFEDNYKKQQFKYKLAKSFYNFLTKTKLFEVTPSKPFPNQLLLCIAKLIEFCLIPVGNIDDLDDIKIKKIRNWLKRNDFEPNLTSAEIIPDKERLLKYFEPELINITNDIKEIEAISVGFFLGKRFNIEHLVPDLIHIAQALRESVWVIGHQMFMGGDQSKAPFEEFENFQKLIKGVKSNKKITTVKFKLEGDDKEYELIQRLPLYLIEEAIKDYSVDNQVEVDTDLIKTKVTRTIDGGLKIEKENQFAQPEERFMVRFVKSFYDYLLNEAKLDTKDYIPSEKYYSIIAQILHQTWFFYHLRNPEWFIIAKVKQWHKLALNK